jgi:hypothetical protein
MAKPLSAVRPSPASASSSFSSPLFYSESLLQLVIFFLYLPLKSVVAPVPVSPTRTGMPVSIACVPSSWRAACAQ